MSDSVISNSDQNIDQEWIYFPMGG
jgi:hypothetical protein